MGISYKMISLAVLLAALAIGSGGCAGSMGATPEAATTGAMRQRVAARDLLSLLPADVIGAVRVDMATLLESAWTRELLTTAVARNAAVPAMVQGFLERTEEVVIGMREVAEGEPHAPRMVIFQGRYTAADMESRNPADVPGAYRGHPLLSRPDANTVSLLLDDHTAIWGDADMVHTALDVVDGLLPARGPQSEMYRSAAERVGMRRHAFSWVVGMRAILRARGNPIADAPSLLAFWADVDSSVEAGAFLSFTDPSVASLYMQAVDVALPQLLADPRVAELDLRGVLERLVVHVEDGELRAQLTLGPDETSRLVRALESLIEDAE